MLYQVIIVIHILLGLGIIGLVLIQHGKGADAGAAFGSGGSGSVFGAQGSASFLSRTTAIFAGLFFLTSLSLAVLSGVHGKKADILDSISSEEVSTVAPAASAPSDVPLSQIKSSPDEVPQNNPGLAPAEAPQVQMESVPEAPAIKEVEPAQDAQPKSP